MNFIKTYYLELLVFGAIFTILMVCLNPDYTFMNKSADSMGYIYAAKYLYPAYHTSAPFYLLISHLFLQIPFGTDAWCMGLVSVFSTMGGCVFIYLTARHLFKSRLYAIIALLLYGTSAMVISQSIIVNTYPLTTMCAIGAYYFAVKNKWKLSALMIGVAMATHLLGVLMFFCMLGFRNYRTNWKALLLSLSFILFYLYIPITQRPPYMWLQNTGEVGVFAALVEDVVGVVSSLVGSLSIWELPKRILDTIGIVGLSVGVVSVIPIIYFIKKTGKRILLNPLFWLAFAPIVLFVSELDMNTFDYTMVGIPFLIIMGCYGLKELSVYKIGKSLVYAVIIVAAGLGIFHANYFDIGRTLDRNMSAANLYHNEFAKIPDGAYFMPNGGWVWQAIYLYNKDNDKNIYPITLELLKNDLYRNKLIEDGIKLVPSESDNFSIFNAETARSIVALNGNVWTAVFTDSETFGSTVLEAKGNVDLIMMPDRERIERYKTNPDWRWMPSNPYDVLTTSEYLGKWNYAIISYYNFSLFVVLFAVIYAVLIFIPRLFKKKGRMKGDEIFPVSQEEENHTTGQS